MKAWKCTVCNYIHKGDTPPDKCPVCGAGPDKFVEIEIPDSQEKTAAAPSKASGAAPDTSPPDTSKQSGGITTTEEKKTAPTGPQTLYQRITDLMIRHHAHPILVHTPNGILPAAAVLFILAWLFDATLPAKAAVINLIFVVLALPLVLYTGFLEWQKKYNQAYTLLFKLKILAAALTSAACVISMIWYLADPAVLSTPLAWVFIFINIVMLASAGVAGFIGGKLVFKD